ncbi:hypothetical protein SDC9_43962 [bioreactor metagenome]|uniref:Uncharacterized protein n=1 Tax=bioreactor metagenome TaxID=1076179 RepID=A0A644W2F2_9ZZZZ
MNKVFLFLIAGVLFCSSVFAQTAEIQNVRKREFRGVSPIKNIVTNEVTGYYTFYVNEKVGDGMVSFNVDIFDKDLKLLKETPVTITKRSNVDGAEFNGKDFLFVFNDIMKKTLTYVTMDSQGDIIKKETIAEEKRYAATADVFTAQDGFFIVKPIKEKKWGYSIEKIDRELNSIWEKRVTVEKGIAVVEAVSASSDRIVVIEVSKPTLMSSKATAKLLCLSDETGEEIYQYSLYDGTSTCMPSAFLIDKDNNVITGGMYFKGERWDDVNSDGIFFLKLDANGEKQAYSTEDWDEGISKYIKNATAKTVTISSKPKVLFHEIVQTADGQYRLIGETFKKNYQLVSMKVKDAITGRFIGDISNNDDSNKPITFEILDFILFKFDGDAKMTNVSIIPKEHTKISCYTPYNGLGGMRLAQVVKDFGFFNFAFVTTMPDATEPLLVSANFVDEKAYIGINTIDIENDESKFTKIPITRRTIKGGSIGVMPSMPGKLAIYVYSKKDENILIYFEDIKL